MVTDVITASFVLTLTVVILIFDIVRVILRKIKIRSDLVRLFLLLLSIYILDHPVHVKSQRLRSERTTVIQCLSRKGRNLSNVNITATSLVVVSN